MRDWRTIAGKRVWTSERHNYVLEAWAEVCTTPHVLVSFDSHTDTRPAFSGAAKKGHDPEQLFVSVNWRSLPEVRHVIPTLRHDEHIDAALRAVYISRALIVLAVPTPGSATGVGEILLGHSDERLLNDTLLEDETLRPKLAHAEPLTDFVLDIDLDAFRSMRSIEPEHGEYFDSLIRRAACITVAREPECVASLRFEEIVSADLEKALYERIARAAAG